MCLGQLGGGTNRKVISEVQPKSQGPLRTFGLNCFRGCHAPAIRGWNRGGVGKDFRSIRDDRVPRRIWRSTGGAANLEWWARGVPAPGDATHWRARRDSRMPDELADPALPRRTFLIPALRGSARRGRRRLRGTLHWPDLRRAHACRRGCRLWESGLGRSLAPGPSYSLPGNGWGICAW